MQKFDIVCFGSATQDIFIKIHPKVLGKNVCFYPGSKTQIEEINYFSGGGAINTSVGFSRLGFKTAIMSVIGNDVEGKELVSELKQEKVNTENIFVEKRKTSRSIILTGFGRDRIILSYSKTFSALQLKHIFWDNIFSNWFYISSLHSSVATLKKIVDFAGKKGIRVALNPGMSEIKEKQKLLQIIKKTDVLILNEEEAKALCANQSTKQNLNALSRLAKVVAITCGKKGAYAQSGKKVFFQNAFRAKVVDVTGAGDAFSSAFVSAIMVEKPVDFALKSGCANAAAEVQGLGTKNTLLTQKQLNNAVEKSEN